MTIEFKFKVEEINFCASGTRTPDLLRMQLMFWNVGWLLFFFPLTHPPPSPSLSGAICRRIWWRRCPWMLEFFGLMDSPFERARISVSPWDLSWTLLCKFTVFLTTLLVNWDCPSPSTSYWAKLTLSMIWLLGRLPPFSRSDSSKATCRYICRQGYWCKRKRMRISNTSSCKRGQSSGHSFERFIRTHCIPSPDGLRSAQQLKSRLLDARS